MGQQLFYSSSALQTTLGASLTSSGTSVELASKTGYPTQFPFNLLLEWGTANQEKVRVTQAATGSGPYTYANCVRGADGTTAVAHSSGAAAYHGVAAEDFFQFPPVYNVCYYGADPTGVADSTTAIQAAINAVPSGSGGVVFLPQGTYTISSPLTLSPKTVLAGAGQASTVLSVTSGTFTASLPSGVPAVVYVPDGAGGATISAGVVRDLTINGSNYVGASAIDAIQIYGPAVGGQIRNVTILAMSGWGINTTYDSTAASYPFSWSCSNIVIANGTNSANGGLNLNFTSDSTWVDVYCLGNNGTGFVLNSTDNNRFVGCRSEWSGGYGWHITGSWYTAAGSGASMWSGCSTDRNTKDGFLIDATGDTPMNFTGIYCRRDGSNSLSGGGSYAGFHVSNAAVPVTLEGYTCYPGTNDDGTGTSSPQYGISISGSTSVTVGAGFAQAATAAVNIGSGNTTLVLGPGLVQATGTTSAQTISGPIFSLGQSSSAQVIATSGTITTAGMQVARVAPTGAVTGVILGAGTAPGQVVTVINESTGADSVTFAASGTSHVADGTSDVIAGLTARQFVWDAGTSLWYRMA